MKIKYFNLLLGVLLMVSCNKQLVKLDTPDFDVKTDVLTYKAGQLINFNLTGNAHVISFYSGETLKDYTFKGGRIIDVKGAGATMEFSSSVQAGTTQANQLSILASTDFNGDYSSLAKVKTATWTDITSRFALGTSATLLASGKQDISDLAITGKPIYIAFKYLTKPQATNGLARQWFIQNFAIKSIATLANTSSTTPITLTLADQLTVGFRIVDGSPVSNPAQSSVSATRLTLWGNEYRYAGLSKYDPTLPIYNPANPIYDPQSSSYIATAVYKPYAAFDPASPDNDPLCENWAVSTPVNLESVNLGPDLSTTIKVGITAAPLSLFNYTYAAPGTFKAVFVGSNNSIEETKEVIKEITFTITQ